MKNDLEIFLPFGKKGKFAERIEGSNCLIYTRVSTKEQEKGFSLETQKRVIEQACASNNLTILSYFGGVYESAKNDERAEFNRMLNFARKSKERVSHIMVYSVDRFSRSGANAIYIAEQLRQENIKIFAVTQPSDTFTATGKMQQNMQFIFSEYDNDLRREKCVAGMKEMLLNGYWPGKPPIGYDQKTRKKRDMGAMTERQTTSINEKGKLIRKAFLWKAEDRLTNAEIITRLKPLGLTVYKQQLCKILANPFYCGLMAHNMLNGEVVPGRHDPLISREIFLKANSIKTRNGVWTHRKDFEEIPLKNFMKCEHCGSSFCGYVVKKKNLWYYKCNKTGCKCNRSATSINDLFVKNELSKFTIDEKYIEPIKLGFIKYFDSLIKTSEADTQILTTRLQEASKKIESIEERFAIGEIDKELYQKFITKYKKERAEITKEIEGNKFKNSNLENRLEKYCSILRNVPLLWTSNDYRGKLELQELLFPQGITFNKENNTFRTPEINQVAFIMSQLARDAAGQTKGDTSQNCLMSPYVPRRGLEPLHLTAYAPQAYLYTIPTPGQSHLFVYFPVTTRTNTRAKILIACKQDQELQK